MLKVSFASHLQPLSSTIHHEQIATPLQIEFQLFWRIHASRMPCSEEIECGTAEHRVGTIEIGRTTFDPALRRFALQSQGRRYLWASNLSLYGVCLRVECLCDQ